MNERNHQRGLPLQDWIRQSTPWANQFRKSANKASEPLLLESTPGCQSKNSFASLPKDRSDIWVEDLTRRSGCSLGNGK